MYFWIAWNIDNKQLVKKIVIILEKNSSIQKDIWSYKRKNSKRKSKISYFKALTKKLFQNKLQIKDVLKEKKAIIYYNIMVKNQIIQTEKRWKRAKKTLRVTSVRLPYKDNICK